MGQVETSEPTSAILPVPLPKPPESDAEPTPAPPGSHAMQCAARAAFRRGCREDERPKPGIRSLQSRPVEIPGDLESEPRTTVLHRRPPIVDPLEGEVGGPHFQQRSPASNARLQNCPTSNAL